MKRRTIWAAFFTAVTACSIVGPMLILLYIYFDYPYGPGEPILINYDSIAIICPAWLLGVAEHNSGPTIAFIIICTGNLMLNLFVSTFLLLPARLPFGSIASLFFAVAIVLAWAISFLEAGRSDQIWLAILIAAALYWVPVAVKMRLDARRTLGTS